MKAQHVAERMSGARVQIVNVDQYDAGTRQIFLTTRTAFGGTEADVLRACHEAAHAIQHRDRHRSMMLRIWFPHRLILGLATVLLLCGQHWTWMLVGLVAWLVGFCAILVNEHMANRMAVEWLMGRGMLRNRVQASEYLGRLTKTYWLSTWT